MEGASGIAGKAYQYNEAGKVSEETVLDAEGKPMRTVQFDPDGETDEDGKPLRQEG